MKNPYEVLEIKPGSSKDEIRAAYKKMVKKYHPDQYANNPLSDLASEKLKEINEAYDTLIKENDSGSNGYSNSSSRGNYSGNSYSSSQSQNSSFTEVRTLLQRGLLNDADARLNASTTRNAEWYYLKGMISIQRGWYDQGRQYLMQAVQMDPTNFEYRNSLNQVNFNSGTGARYNNQNTDACNICGGLICADCLCECCGGDLIACC